VKFIGHRKTRSAKEVHNKTMNFTRFGYVDEFFMNTRFAEVKDLQCEYFKVGCSCGNWGNNGEMMEFDGGNTGRNSGNIFIGSSCNIGCCSNENVNGKGRSMSEQ
jgi:hypothetical protein